MQNAENLMQMGSYAVRLLLCLPKYVHFATKSSNGYVVISK